MSRPSTSTTGGRYSAWISSRMSSTATRRRSRSGSPSASGSVRPPSPDALPSVTVPASAPVALAAPVAIDAAALLPGATVCTAKRATPSSTSLTLISRPSRGSRPRNDRTSASTFSSAIGCDQRSSAARTAAAPIRKSTSGGSGDPPSRWSVADPGPRRRGSPRARRRGGPARSSSRSRWSRRPPTCRRARGHDGCLRRSRRRPSPDAPGRARSGRLHALLEVEQLVELLPGLTFQLHDAMVVGRRQRVEAATPTSAGAPTCAPRGPRRRRGWCRRGPRGRRGRWRG